MIKLVTVPKQKRKQGLVAFLLGVFPYGSVLRYDTLDHGSLDGMDCKELKMLLDPCHTVSHFT